jgi:hypothetical protein
MPGDFGADASAVTPRLHFEPVGEIIGEQNHLSALIGPHRLSPLLLRFALLPKGYGKARGGQISICFFESKAEFPIMQKRHQAAMTIEQIPPAYDFQDFAARKQARAAVTASRVRGFTTSRWWKASLPENLGEEARHDLAALQSGDQRLFPSRLRLIIRHIAVALSSGPRAVR